MLKQRNHLLCMVFTIPSNLQKEWMDFMQNTQIPEILSKGYHLATESGRLIVLDDDGEILQIQITYYFESKKKMLEYFKKEGGFFKERYATKFAQYGLSDPLTFQSEY